MAWRAEAVVLDVDEGVGRMRLSAWMEWRPFVDVGEGDGRDVERVDMVGKRVEVLELLDKGSVGMVVVEEEEEEVLFVDVEGMLERWSPAER